mmetsp:Transcript_26899/g.49832  ORF Transcript_26899/g.49832 Transcript_26899/m.49832 type:complete len:230 (-) Transcript_26899:717-1406(-)
MGLSALRRAKIAEHITMSCSCVEGRNCQRRCADKGSKASATSLSLTLKMNLTSMQWNPLIPLRSCSWTIISAMLQVYLSLAYLSLAEASNLSWRLFTVGIYSPLQPPSHRCTALKTLTCVLRQRTPSLRQPYRHQGFQMPHLSLFRPRWWVLWHSSSNKSAIQVRQSKVLLNKVTSCNFCPSCSTSNGSRLSSNSTSSNSGSNNFYRKSLSCGREKFCCSNSRSNKSKS